MYEPEYQQFTCKASELSSHDDVYVLVGPNEWGWVIVDHLEMSETISDMVDIFGDYKGRTVCLHRLADDLMDARTDPNL